MPAKNGLFVAGINANIALSARENAGGFPLFSLKSARCTDSPSSDPSVNSCTQSRIALTTARRAGHRSDADSSFLLHHTQRSRKHWQLRSLKLHCHEQFGAFSQHPAVDEWSDEFQALVTSTTLRPPLRGHSDPRMGEGPEPEWEVLGCQQDPPVPACSGLVPRGLTLRQSFVSKRHPSLRVVSASQQQLVPLVLRVRRRPTQLVKNAPIAFYETN